MSVLLLAQLIALVLTTSLGLSLLRRAQTIRARRAAAFEDFAEGRGLTLYRIAGDAPVYRLTDAAGTVVTVETAPAPFFARRRAGKPGIVTVALPGPRLSRGFVAMVAGADGAVSERGLRLDRALRGIGRDSDAVKIVALGDAVALLSDVPADQAPDLHALRAALADPALRPDAGGTAMIALNPEGLHLRLGRTIEGPGTLEAILDALRALRGSLDTRDRRDAA